jgi:hypothetical protein
MLCCGIGHGEIPRMSDAQSLQKKASDPVLLEREIELERARLSMEFARYGFAGTLTAAVLGIILILSLAVLNAFTTFKIETWGLVAISGMVFAGSVAFGYLSLWKIPKVLARFRGTEIAISDAEGAAEESRPASPRARKKERLS